jgi:hypothetical protein
MKQVTLTSIGSETSLQDGSSIFLLVFNGGDFRLSVSQEQAQAVLGYAVDGEAQLPEQEAAPPDPNEMLDEDEVPQV